MSAKDTIHFAMEDERNVFFGPGFALNKIRRQSFYRDLIREHFKAYSQIQTDSGKREYVRACIVNEIWNVGGKFYVWSKRDEKWRETKDQKLLFRKVSQALRDQKKGSKVDDAKDSNKHVEKLKRSARATRSSHPPSSGDAGHSKSGVLGSPPTLVGEFPPPSHFLHHQSSDCFAPELKAFESYGTELSFLRTLEGEVEMPSLAVGNGATGATMEGENESPISHLLMAIHEREEKITLIKAAVLNRVAVDPAARDAVDNALQMLDDSLRTLGQSLGLEDKGNVSFASI